MEELHDLDQSQVASLHSVKEDLQTMKSFLADMESKFKSGELSVGSYSMKAIRDIDAYQSIKESVDGEDGLIDDSLELILQKMENGETLTDVEQDELYDYTQNIMLDDKKRKEIEDIASFMSEEDIGKLTERLNEKVVVSADALEEEIAMIQGYVFLGTQTPKETGVAYYKRRKLQTYLMLLKSYHSRIVEDDQVLLVGKVDFKEDHNGVFGYYLESVMQTAKYAVDEDLMDKDDFRKLAFFDPDHFIMPKIESTEVTYATGENATANIRKSELKSIEGELANYEADFIVTEIFGKAISLLLEKANVDVVIDTGKSIIQFQSVKEEKEGKVKIESALIIAEKLDLEVAISEDGSGKELNIQLYPLEETFTKIERWKELHNADNSDIPFPEEEINSHDWYEVGEKLYEIEEEYGSEVTDYISSYKEGVSVDDLEKGKK